MQRAIEEGEQAGHAAETDQVRQAKGFAERRDGEGEDHEANRPRAGVTGVELDRVGGEVVIPGAPAEPENRHETGEKDQHLGPAFLQHASAPAARNSSFLVQFPVLVPAPIGAASEVPCLGPKRWRKTTKRRGRWTSAATA